MLLSTEQVVKATRLSNFELNVAMRSSGFPNHDVITSEYAGMTANGSFVYRVLHRDDHNEVIHANVYAHYTLVGGAWAVSVSF